MIADTLQRAQSQSFEARNLFMIYGTSYWNALFMFVCLKWDVYMYMRGLLHLTIILHFTFLSSYFHTRSLHVAQKNEMSA